MYLNIKIINCLLLFFHIYFIKLTNVFIYSSNVTVNFNEEVKLQVKLQGNTRFLSIVMTNGLLVITLVTRNNSPPVVGGRCGSGGEPAGGVGCYTRGLGLGCDASCRRRGSRTPTKVENLPPPEPQHVS